MFFKFPYTDLYTLNLDWMIKFLKEAQLNLEQWQEIIDSLGTIVHSVNGQTGEVNLGTLVNSVNGQTGNVNLGTLVNSVNGKTGDVEIDNDDINALKIELVLQTTDPASTFTPTIVTPLFNSGIRFIIINNKEFYSITEAGAMIRFNPFEDLNISKELAQPPANQAEIESLYNQGIRFIRYATADMIKHYALEKIDSVIVAYDLDGTNGANLFNFIDSNETIADYSTTTLQSMYNSGVRILFQDETNGIRKFYALLGTEVDGYTGYTEYDPVSYFDNQWIPSLQQDISSLKSAIAQITINWEQGNIGTSAGAESDSNTFIRTNGYISNDINNLTADTGYRFNLLAYDQSNTYIGAWNSTNRVFQKANIYLTSVDLNFIKCLFPNYKYRIRLGKTNSGAIIPSDGKALSFYPTSGVEIDSDNLLRETYRAKIAEKGAVNGYVAFPIQNEFYSGTLTQGVPYLEKTTDMFTIAMQNISEPCYVHTDWSKYQLNINRYVNGEFSSDTWYYEDAPVVTGETIRFIVRKSSAGDLTDADKADIIANTYFRKGVSSSVKPLPSYYTDNVENGVERYKSIKNNVIGDSFCFLTDVHLFANSMNSGAILRYIGENTDCKKVFCGGDISVAYNANMSEEFLKDYVERWLASMRSFKGIMDYYGMRGNHDMYGYTSSEMTTKYELKYGGAYAVTCGANSEVTKTGDYGAMYYAVDNVKEKIRYICCDTSDTSDTKEDCRDRMRVTTAQLQWVADTMMEVDDDWSIVVLGHIACSDDLYSFPESEPAATELAALGSILKDYKNKRSTNTYGDFTNAKGELVAYICGHAHTDKAVVDDGLLFIQITCDSRSQIEKTGSIYNWTRKANTVSEQAIDVFTVDTQNKKLYATRFGVGGYGDTTNNITSENIFDREWSY